MNLDQSRDECFCLKNVFYLTFLNWATKNVSFCRLLFVTFYGKRLEKTFFQLHAKAIMNFCNVSRELTFSKRRETYNNKSWYLGWFQDRGRVSSQ